jgi:hypothetical protein
METKTKRERNDKEVKDFGSFGRISQKHLTNKN